MTTRRPSDRGPEPFYVPDARPWALVFIVVAILALAGVPIYTSREIAREEILIEEVLEPAQRHAAELALVQTRLMLRFREWLLTGDPDERIRYQALRDVENSTRHQLLEVLERMDVDTYVDVRRQAMKLISASVDWRVGHQGALVSDTARLAYLAQADVDQDRYEQMVADARVFRESINGLMAEGRAAAAAARERQLRLTIALLVLALLAAVAVALVGRRLRRSIEEATLRRRDAVRSRWEVDAILEATGDGVLGVDLDGRILSLNATGSRLLGYTEEEARGRSLHDLLHGAAAAGEAHDVDTCPLLEVLREEGGAERVDDRVWHRRGRAVPVRWALRPLMDGKVVRGAVLTLTDMTAVREAERALREAVQAREETMAVVSHDLRNPLGSISAAAELLLEVPLGPDRTRKQLNMIRKAAERSNRLIDDLLDVARIDAGALSVRTAPCPVRPLLDEAAALISPRANEKSLAVEVRSPGDLPRIEADRDRMIQVLGNLLVNAVRHTPEGGRIVASASRRGEDEVALSVTDSGPGIAPEDQAHLFDRFWRRDRSDRSGAGLGLAIVKGIVEAHGGTVEVDSRMGSGATFTVVVPVVLTQRPPERADRPPTLAGAPAPATPGDAPPRSS